MNENLKMFRHMVNRKVKQRDINILLWKEEVLEYLEMIFFDQNQNEILPMLNVLNFMFDYKIPIAIKYAVGDGYWFPNCDEYMEIYEEVKEFINNDFKTEAN